MSRINHNRGGFKPARAFTVTELLVAVSLMTLIVLALFSMFNQTQKALLSNEAQVDSAERGRGVLELVSRELESVRVGLRRDTTNLWLHTQPLPTLSQNDFSVGNPQSIVPLRTNVFDDVYYLAKADKAWRGIGYFVSQATNLNPNTSSAEALAPAATGLGTLYRYETPLTNRDYAFPSTNLFIGFITNLPTPSAPPTKWPAATNFSQISQGVVHFKVRPFDSNGQLMAFGTTNLDSNYRMLRKSFVGTLRYPFSNIDRSAETNGAANVILQQASITDLLNTTATFTTNAVPAYLELELGILEPEALRTYQQMMKDEDGKRAKEFLERRIAKVQIFRKRIPLRTAAQ